MAKGKFRKLSPSSRTLASYLGNLQSKLPVGPRFRGTYVRSTPYPVAKNVKDTYAKVQRGKARIRHLRPEFRYRHKVLITRGEIGND